ncbi:MAG: SEC-C metal-binding domain-containing protein [Planctomycetaceae bacterium]
MTQTREIIRRAVKDQVQSSRRVIDDVGRTAELAIKLAEDVRVRLMAYADSSPEKGKVACCSGCWFCCTMPVAVSAPEAIAIAEYLNRTLAESDLEKLKAELTDTVNRIRGLTVTQHAATIIRCPLLDPSGRCSVYSVRPIACVRFTSKSVARCEEMYKNPEDSGLANPQDNTLRMGGDAAEYGFRAAIRESGFDDGRYELNSAVLAALTDSRASIKWASGNRLFSKCINRDPPPENAKAEQSLVRDILGTPQTGSTAQRNEACPCGSGKKYKKCCGSVS